VSARQPGQTSSWASSRQASTRTRAFVQTLSIRCSSTTGGSGGVGQGRPSTRDRQLVDGNSYARENRIAAGTFRGQALMGVAAADLAAGSQSLCPPAAKWRRRVDRYLPRSRWYFLFFLGGNVPQGNENAYLPDGDVGRSAARPSLRCRTAPCSIHERTATKPPCPCVRNENRNDLSQSRFSHRRAPVRRPSRQACSQVVLRLTEANVECPRGGGRH